MTPIYRHWDEAGPAPASYRDPVNSQRVPGGVVHKLPADLRKALIASGRCMQGGLAGSGPWLSQRGLALS